MKRALRRLAVRVAPHTPGLRDLVAELQAARRALLFPPGHYSSPIPVLDDVSRYADCLLAPVPQELPGISLKSVQVSRGSALLGYLRRQDVIDHDVGPGGAQRLHDPQPDPRVGHLSPGPAPASSCPVSAQLLPQATSAILTQGWMARRTIANMAAGPNARVVSPPLLPSRGPASTRPTPRRIRQPVK